MPQCQPWPRQPSQLHKSVLPQPYQLSLFIFRRDLRCCDNTALIKARALSKEVLPCFIFDPRQCEQHPYRSDFALRFLLESLEDLQGQLAREGGRLCVLEGKAEDVVARLLRQYPIEAVFINRDYTPFSVTRDLAIQQCVQKEGRMLFMEGDALLHEPQEVNKPDGKGPYTVYTPFYRRASRLPVRPVNQKGKRLSGRFTTDHGDVPLARITQRLLSSCDIPESPYQGGRDKALKIVKRIASLRDYETARNIPSLNATTHLSAHLKFGTLSVREAYHAIASSLTEEHALIKELYWRDFFTHIGYHYPHVFGHAFDSRYDAIPWKDDPEGLKRWCEGITGFPIVDAGMRELKATGFMHNRVRMITASFLVKDLGVDWRKGEHYFATKLIDYDPCVNNGNWQWVASTGCDRQPYFRIFNPWIQQEKFDPQAEYIKRWIPELAKVKVEDIHGWAHRGLKLSHPYPQPMGDHAQMKESTLEMFKVSL